jgi:hypothetical protein
MQQASPNKVAKAKNLYFKTTDTPRGQNINKASLGGNYVIDVDGSIYEVSAAEGETAAITIIGGIDTFVSEKQYRPYVFYLTQRQKITIYNILREIATVTDKAQIHAAENELLDHLLTNTYSNYCG